ncbi:MAG: hypothetical protein FWF43_07070, partial [Propionibacteriaceae bacterium]|nr:hypothetical protein [Propionibacteriaceae bacterium]
MISRTFTERMGTSAGSVVVAVAVLLMVSGCSGGGQGVTPTSTSTSMSTSLPSVAPPVVAPGVGRVDMGTASFTVPIDAYGMSVQDMNIVQAAHAVRFDLCFYREDTLQADQIALAQAWLTDTPVSSRWFFGAWDAEFIAQNGWPGVPTNGPRLYPGEPTPDQITASQACVNDDASVLEFTPSSPMYGFPSPNELENWWGEGFVLTQSDQRFLDLTDQRNACVVQKGYSVSVQSGENYAQLDYQASWSEEQELAAQIAVAQCSDDMNYTQQWVDIVAAYQMETIKQHEAELTAIKLNLDDLVAKATDVLTMYGVM